VVRIDIRNTLTVRWLIIALLGAAFHIFATAIFNLGPKAQWVSIAVGAINLLVLAVFCKGYDTIGFDADCPSLSGDPRFGVQKASPEKAQAAAAGSGVDLTGYKASRDARRISGTHVPTHR
jgi:hypothetical protein